MISITILNENSIPLHIEEESQIIIKGSIVTKLTELEELEYLPEEYLSVWKDIKNRLAFAEQKNSKNKDTIYFVPPKKEIKKRMQRKYIAFYGNQYALMQ